MNTKNSFNNNKLININNSNEYINNEMNNENMS